jgi:hypothetical protein
VKQRASAEKRPDMVERALVIEKRELVWYPEEKREALLKRLHDYATDPPRRRTKSIAIIGERNSGKSSIIDRYQVLHPRVRGPEGQVVPSLRVNMTDVTNVSDLSIRLLEELEALEPASGTHTQRMKRFYALAVKVQLGPIFLDEFHDCVSTTGRGQPFLRLIKGMGNHGLLVVPLGTAELADVLHGDPQLSSRFNFGYGRLPPVSGRAVVRRLMKGMADHLDVQLSDQAADFVLTITKGNIGQMLDLLEETLLDQGEMTLPALMKQAPLIGGMEKID